jgi:predicted GH43/DUF377 family glycosyl hydrolase
MIILTQSAAASPLVHTPPTDPGITWTSASIAIDAPPDSDADPAPNAQWPAEATRTGLCGAVSPRVVALAGGDYRMYYTQILPRDGFPAGANNYDNATSRILSATSFDGVTWKPEGGIRLSPQQGGAGDFRVVSSEVVPVLGKSGKLRMYFDCCPGTQSQPNSIRSAVSNDGLNWAVEAGERFALVDGNVSAPRIVFLDDGRCRLYCNERGRGIISTVSDDGLAFELEPRIRVAPDSPHDQLTAFAPEILRLVDGSYRMYYAGYRDAKRADILTAVSSDGLTWEKVAEPVHSPGSKSWDAAKCSEMCVIWNPHNRSAGFHMLYEACDGTSDDQRGVWRIGCAVSS